MPRSKKANTSKSSRIWLDRQRKDVFVKKSKQEGYRSRAAYKLLELQAKYNFLKPGMKVIDLGAAPGSWSQVASKIIFSSNAGERAKLIAVDILPIEPIKNVDIISGDFNNKLIFQQICDLIDNLAVKIKSPVKVDVILSDLAPNLSGIWPVDIPKSIYLCELAMELVRSILKKDGDFILKMFNGEGTEQYLMMLRKNFSKIIISKPKSSRSESREIYVVARGYKLT